MKNTLLRLCACCFWILPAHAQLGLGLVPMRVEIKNPPDGQYTDSVRLNNDSPGRMRVRAQTLDFYIDNTLTPQFGAAFQQEARLSCREWLQINPREFDIEGNGNARVRYTLRVPPGTAEGEYHCAAGFVTLPPLRGGAEPITGVRIAVRAVASFYVIIGNPDPKPVLKDLSLKARPDGTWEAAALFENQGARSFRVNGFLEVQDSQGQRIEREDYNPFPVLPLREQVFPIPLKVPLTPGQYTLRTQADVGLPQILEGTVHVMVDASQ